jgi:hypothetical protein
MFLDHAGQGTNARPPFLQTAYYPLLGLLVELPAETVEETVMEVRLAGIVPVPAALGSTMCDHEMDHAIKVSLYIPDSRGRYAARRRSEDENEMIKE